MFRARQKVFTGCMSCRRRRKKCNEVRPICSGCERNGLSCNWPSAREGKGMTSKQKPAPKTSKPSVETHQSPISWDAEACEFAEIGPDSLAFIPTSYSLPYTSLSIFESDIHVHVFQYCTYLFIPSQVHPQSGRLYEDPSYMVSISLFFPPLLDAMMACAALTLPNDAQHYRDFAIQKYHSAVHELRCRIADNSLLGTEDYLLAAVMWLCIFENSHHEWRSKCNLHVQAMSTLLSLRNPLDRTTSALSELALERICVESFIYHSATVMLFDNTVDPVLGVQRLIKKFETCLTRQSTTLLSECSTEDFYHSPVLGAPSDIFLMLMEATRLARSTQPLSSACISNIWQRYWQLVNWGNYIENDLDIQDWPGKLYVLATRILLLRSVHEQDDITVSIRHLEVQQAVGEGLRFLRTQKLGVPFGKYYLWPLAILGSVVVAQEDVALVREKFDYISQRSNSRIVHQVRTTLEDIWAARTYCGSGFILDGLEKLLKGAIMNPSPLGSPLGPEDLMTPTTLKSWAQGTNSTSFERCADVDEVCEETLK